MADTLQFDLVAPERKLASLAATSVQLPGMEGDLTAMPNHAPFLTTLRPGVVKVAAGADSAEYVVTGGFAEVSPTAATVLAEQAVPRGEAAGDLLAQLMAEAEAALANAPAEGKMAASQRVRDVASLKALLGL